MNRKIVIIGDGSEAYQIARTLLKSGYPKEKIVVLIAGTQHHSCFHVLGVRIVKNRLVLQKADVVLFALQTADTASVVTRLHHHNFKKGASFFSFTPNLSIGTLNTKLGLPHDTIGRGVYVPNLATGTTQGVFFLAAHNTAYAIAETIFSRAGVLQRENSGVVKKLTTAAKYMLHLDAAFLLQYAAANHRAQKTSSPLHFVCSEVKVYLEKFHSHTTVAGLVQAVTHSEFSRSPVHMWVCAKIQAYKILGLRESETIRLAVTTLTTSSTGIVQPQYRGVLNEIRFNHSCYQQFKQQNLFTMTQTLSRVVTETHYAYTKLHRP
jgi:hypothetical protein